MEEGEQGMQTGGCRGMTCTVFGPCEKHYVIFCTVAVVETLKVALLVPQSPSPGNLPHEEVLNIWNRKCPDVTLDQTPF